MTAPAWEEIRDGAWAVTDEPNRHLAAYPVSDGRVVIALHDGGDELHRVILSLQDVDALKLKLGQAAHIAEPIAREQEARAAGSAAQTLIDRVKGTP